MGRSKKILTLDDLVKFCKIEKFYNFSAKNTGYQLAVQIPSTFEISNEYTDNTLLFCNVKLFHIGENRNHSSVTKDAATKALSTIAYKPLLANFCEIDGVKDFTAHDMIINKDGDVEYIERQIGCFTADVPEIKYDEDTDKEFVFARVAIPREYTDACDIIERKNGTKVSVELLINEMQYSVDKQVLELTDIIVSGATCLGKNPETGEDVQEGMKGARLDIEDFSNKNNSIFNIFSNDYQTKMIEVLDKLNTTLSNFNNNSKEKGCDKMGKFEELLQQYNVTTEDITFEIEGLSDEDLEAKFKEAFEDNTSTGDDSSVNEETENVSASENNDGEVSSLEFTHKKTCSVGEDGNMTVSFEISHEDIRGALYTLLEVYEQEDNEWYWVTNVFDNYFIFENWDGNKLYKQSYVVDGDNVSLSGDRQEMFKMILTESEKLAIEKMREDYAVLEAKYNELQTFKDNYDAAQVKAQKDAIFAREEYSVLAEDDAFKALVSDATRFSVEEVESKVKSIFADFVIKTGEFSTKKDDKKMGSMHFSTKSVDEANKKPYGSLFNN